MDISDRYAYEGPRTPAQAEWEDAIGLSCSIFFKNIPDHREAYATWPMHFRPEARESTFVMFYQGQPVSSINRLCRDIVVRGQALRMGFIGGVCTHPDHRGNGLAGTVLYATLQRFADDDVDLSISQALALCIIGQEQITSATLLCFSSPQMRGNLLMRKI